MKRRFVIAAPMTPEAEKEFVAYIREQGFGWWHRITGFWLITDRNNKASVNSLRDKIKELGVIGSTSLVMEFQEDIDWAATFPRGKTDTLEWLRNTWIDKEAK